MWPQMYISAPIPTIDARICTRRHPLAWLPQGGDTPGLRHNLVCREIGNRPENVSCSRWRAG
jgi:hypothetical protein